METELYKARSLAHCTKAAYDLFSTNLKSIVRQTWLPAVIVALLSAGAQLIVTTGLPLLDMAHGASVSPAPWGIAYLCILLLGWCALVWFATRAVGMLNGLPIKTNLPRISRLFLCATAIVLVCAIGLTTVFLSLDLEPVSGTMFPFAPLPVALIALGAAVLVTGLIPCCYSATKYYMEPRKRVGSLFGKPYRRGWRHWGFLFSAVLLVCIIVSTLTAIIGMPLNIVQMAVWTDFMGQSMGDPSGLPSAFTVLTFVTAMFCTFLWLYIVIWGNMVFYYAYGTIEAKARARRPADTDTAMPEHHAETQVQGTAEQSSSSLPPHRDTDF